MVFVVFNLFLYTVFLDDCKLFIQLSQSENLTIKQIVVINYRLAIFIITTVAKVFEKLTSEGSKSSTHYLSDTNRFDVSSKGPSSERRICLYRLGSE